MTDDVPLLYRDLADWWPVLSDPAEYAEEAVLFERALIDHCEGDCSTVLELGCGGGNSASHLKSRFRMTLTDYSAGMLAVSRALNPECEHVQADMRTLRLGRTFDAVFAQDAVSYMTTEDDVAAVVSTAAAHLRPGGVVLLVPDFTQETFRPGTETGGHDAPDGRSLRYLSWVLPPAAEASVYEEHFAYLLREADGATRGTFDTHRLGLFPRATWLAALEAGGFSAHALPYELSSFDAAREMFVGTL